MQLHQDPYAEWWGGRYIQYLGGCTSHPDPSPGGDWWLRLGGEDPTKTPSNSLRKSCWNSCFGWAGPLHWCWSDVVPMNGCMIICTTWCRLMVGVNHRLEGHGWGWNVVVRVIHSLLVSQNISSQMKLGHSQMKEPHKTPIPASNLDVWNSFWEILDFWKIEKKVSNKKSRFTNMLCVSESTYFFPTFPNRRNLGRVSLAGICADAAGELHLGTVLAGHWTAGHLMERKLNQTSRESRPPPLAVFNLFRFCVCFCWWRRYFLLCFVCVLFFRERSRQQ